MKQLTEPLVLHSSDYNLKTVCPNILSYDDRYIKYLNSSFTFKDDLDIINSYSEIEDPEQKISSFSSYLVYIILNNFLDNKAIVKKDVESYYNSQMINFLRTEKLLAFFKLKYLANVWTSISNTVDILIKDLKKYNHSIINKEVYWSDALNNYSHKIPYVGINKDSIDIFLILHKDLEQYPLYNNSIDYLHIPAVLFILNNFVKQNIYINKLKILWLDDSSIKSKVKYITYKDIDSDYIRDNTNTLDYKNNQSLKYNNLKQCYECVYFDQCFDKKVFTSINKPTLIPTIDTTIFEKTRDI